MRHNRPKLEEKQMNEDPNQTPNEPDGDGGTLSAVVESLQAKIKERDAEVERWKKTVEDRDKTITLYSMAATAERAPLGTLKASAKNAIFESEV